MPITHGTTIDLHDLADRSYLKLEASFEDLGHATWVDFTLIHSGRSFDYTRTDQDHENGWWQVCPNRCFALRSTGSVMLKSKVWWGDDHPHFPGGRSYWDGRYYFPNHRQQANDPTPVTEPHSQANLPR